MHILHPYFFASLCSMVVEKWRTSKLGELCWIFEDDSMFPRGCIHSLTTFHHVKGTSEGANASWYYSIPSSTKKSWNQPPSTPLYSATPNFLTSPCFTVVEERKWSTLESYVECLKAIQWVLFGSFVMFFNTCWLDLHNKTCVASTNIQQNICKKLDRKLDLPLVRYSYRKCVFVDSFTRYIDPPTRTHCLSVE